MMTPREKEILAIIRENPLIPQHEIARRLNIARASVGVHISNLAKKGYVLGKGYIIAENHPISLIGCACMEIFAQGKNLEERQVTEGVCEMKLGGLSRNLAEYLSKEGLDVRLISAIAFDPFGERIIAKALKNKVNIQDIEEFDQEKTSTLTHLIGQDAEWITSLADRTILEKMDSRFFKNRLPRIDNSKITFIEGTLPQESVQYLFDQLSKTWLVYDPCQPKGLALLDKRLKDIHLLSVDAYLLAKYLGQKIKEEADFKKAAKTMLARGLKQIAIVDKRGGFLYTDGKDLIYEENQDKAYDHYQKDRYLAALLYALEEEKDPSESLPIFLGRTSEKKE